jgi:hypothetical protein
MKSAPAIREVEPVSENLAKLSVIGIELVDYILLKSSKKLKIKMTYKEHDDKEDEIRFMVKPKGNVEIIVLINATKKLLETAIE